jgi:hypothetical protein
MGFGTGDRPGHFVAAMDPCGKLPGDLSPPKIGGGEAGTMASCGNEGEPLFVWLDWRESKKKVSDSKFLLLTC